MWKVNLYGHWKGKTKKRTNILLINRSFSKRSKHWWAHVKVRPPKDGTPTLPSRLWNIQRDVEWQGKVEDLEAAKEADGKEFETNSRLKRQWRKSKEMTKWLKNSRRRERSGGRKYKSRMIRCPGMASPIPEKEKEEVIQVEKAPEV
jgi:hypothetical protein